MMLTGFLSRIRQLVSRKRNRRHGGRLINRPLNNGWHNRLLIEPLERRELLSVNPIGGEFRVNTYTTNDQRNFRDNPQTIAADAAGNFVVTWTSSNQDGGGDGVYAQRYSSSGVAQGSEFRVNTYTTGIQRFSTVAMADNGAFVITWSSINQDGGNYGIYAQRYDSAGAPQGSEFRVNTYTTSTQINSFAAMDADGDLVIVWSSQDQDSIGKGVFAQRYNSAGVAQGSEFRVNTFSDAHEWAYSVAMDSDGDFVVLWSDSYRDMSGYGVFAQRYNAAGTPQGTEFRVNTYTTGSQRFPTAAMDASGNFVVTWSSFGQDGANYGVYAQRYNAAGVAQGTEFRVNTYTTSVQWSSSVAMDSDGDFVVTWASNTQDTSGYGIYAKSFTAAGDPDGSEFRVPTYTTNGQVFASTAMDSDGDFVVAWTSFGQEGGGYGIYAQRYSAVPLNTLVAIDGSNNLVISDVAVGGKDDALTIQFDAANSVYVISDPNQFLTTVIGGASGSGTHSITVPASAVTGLQVSVQTLDGNDTLTVDYSLGNFSKNIVYAAGNQTASDKLVLMGGTVANVAHALGGSSMGNLSVTGNALLSYLGAESIVDNLSAFNRTFTLPPGSPSAATFADDGVAANGLSRLSAASFATVDFVKPNGALTINRGDAGDTLSVGNLPDLNTGLTIGSGSNELSAITFAGNITLASGKDLKAFAATISLPNNFSDVSTAGGGNISLTTSKNISLASGASLTTVNGDLTLSANQQPVAATGFSAGLSLIGGILLTTGSGDISILARGGDSGFAKGVAIDNGAITGGGIVAVTGTGGPSTNSFNYGIEVSGAAAQISSTGGNVTVSGHGGGSGPTSSQNIGLRIEVNSLVSALGANKLTLLGTGGTGNGGSNHGLLVVGAGASAGNGGLDATGVAGAGNGSVALQLDSGGTLTATNLGCITLNADSIAINAGASVDATGEIVRISPVSPGISIDVGGVDGAGVLGVANAELNRITASTVRLWNDFAFAPIAISQPIAPSQFNTLSLYSGGSVIESAGASITVANLGIGATGPVNLLQSNDFDVLAINDGNGDLQIVDIDGFTLSSVEFFHGANTNSGNITLNVNSGNLTIAATPLTDDLEATGVITINLSGNESLLTFAAGATVRASKGLIAMADKMAIDATISALGQSVTLQPRSGKSVNLGSALDTAANILELSDAELDRIATGTLRLGNGDTSTLAASAPITYSGNLSLTASTINVASSVSSSTGAITLTADDQVIAASISASSSNVTLQNLTAGRVVNLGSGSDGFGFLGLTEEELDRIAASALTIGRNDSSATGPIQLQAPVNMTTGANTVGTLRLKTGDAIDDQSGGEQSDLIVSNLVIEAATGIGVVSDAIDVNVDQLDAQNGSSGDIWITEENFVTVTRAVLTGGTGWLNVDTFGVVVASGSSGNETIRNLGTGRTDIQVRGSGSSMTLGEHAVRSNGLLILTSNTNPLLVANPTGAREILAGSDLQIAAGQIGNATNHLEIEGATSLSVDDGWIGNSFIDEIGSSTISNTFVTVRGAGYGTIDIDYFGSDVVDIDDNADVNHVALDHSFSLNSIDTDALIRDIHVTGGNVQVYGSGVDVRLFDNGITVSTSGNVYLSASGGKRILDADGGTADTITAPGTITLMGDGGIGNSTAPIRLAGSNLSTSSTNGSQFLIVSGSINVTGTLDAGNAPIRLDAGSFELASPNRIGDLSTIVLNGGTLGINSSNDTVAGLTLVSGSITGTTGTLTSTSNLNVQSGTISARMGGAVGLTKTTGGLLTLSGDNLYTGPTTIAGGTLALSRLTSNNNIASSGVIDVQTGAVLDVTGLDGGVGFDTLSLANGQTLKGQGSVVGATIAASGSTISPGASPGVLGTGNITLNSGANLNIEVNGNTSGSHYDQLNVTGTVQLNGAALWISGSYAPLGNEVITIISNDGSDAVVGTFNNLPEASIVNVNGTNRLLTYAGGEGGNDVVLKDLPLQVTLITPTPTGFIAEFNHEFDPSTLNLYDQGGVLGAADVTLTNSALQAVRGSVVVDSTNRKITFIKSGSVLASDTYQVTLASGSNAFKDLFGGLLDGNANGATGDNYIGNFTIAAPASNAITVSMPDFARGYGQPVNLPANGNTGIPVTISTGQGVSGLDFRLHYNPALLDITAATMAAGIDGSVAFIIPTPGTLVVTVSATVEFSSLAGPVTLVNLTATVPATAPYASKELLELAQVHAYDSSADPQELPSIADNGIHVAAYFGDANGSQTYNAPDATLVQRIIVGANSGLSAYQLADPYLIVDVTSNGALQSNDVTLIQRAIVGAATAQIPPYPGLSFVSSGGPDPLVYLPRDLPGNVGDSIRVPVQLLVTEPTGVTLAGADLAIAYDAAVLELDEVAAGQLMIGFGISINRVTPGVVRISFSGDETRDLSYGAGGTLAQLTFRIVSGANSSSTINLLGSSEGFQTGLYDGLGRSLTLLPAPTNDDHDSIDGLIDILGEHETTSPASWQAAVDAAFSDHD